MWEVGDLVLVLMVVWSEMSAGEVVVVMLVLVVYAPVVTDDDDGMLFRPVPDVELLSRCSLLPLYRDVEAVEFRLLVLVLLLFKLWLWL